MARWAGSGRTTCESCKSIDVRRWHRMGYFLGHSWFSWQWTYNGEPAGNIRVYTEPNHVELSYQIRGHGSEWKSIDQRIPILWSPCRYGGRRPWFQCVAYANGRFCDRPVAKLYGAGELFACRRCYNLAYASQSEGRSDRTLRRADKIKQRLGGDPGMAAPFPPKPKGMWRRTYDRLLMEGFDAEMRAEEAFAIQARRLVAKIDGSKGGRRFW